MWNIEYTATTELSPESVWRAVVALQTGEEDLGTDDVRRITGPFQVGGTILVTPAGLGEVTSTITELIPGELLAEQTPFNGLTLLLRHVLKPQAGGGTLISRQLEITGNNADDRANVAGPRISEEYPQDLEAIISTARRLAGERLMSQPVIAEVTESGAGQPILLLHGGGGPATTAPLAQHLAQTSHVIAPTHPGFNGTEPVTEIATVRELANAYGELLIERDLHDVIVVGSSVGGWLAAELALGAAADRLAGIVIINGLGIQVEDHPIMDISTMTPAEFAPYSFHNPSNLHLPPPTPAGIAIAKNNSIALSRLTAEADDNPARLAGINTPTLVMWGASDRIVDTEYGRAYAAAIDGAQFVLIPEAGHLPHLENASAVFEALDAFIATVRPGPTSAPTS